MPEKPPRSLDYAGALALAEADKAEWEGSQMMALEEHFAVAAERLSAEVRERFLDELRATGEDSIEKLKAIGERYGILADFDLQKEGLRVYCNRHEIALTS